MEALRRIFAAGCVLMVFALGVFAASPTLHGKLHGGSRDFSSDTCAVALFAAGVTTVVPVIAQPPSIEEWSELRAVPSDEIRLESPRYLHRPERGPPVA